MSRREGRTLPAAHPFTFPPIIQGQLERHATPEIAPIDHDASTLRITPFLHGLLEFDE
jgi:hypothetical protein